MSIFTLYNATLDLARIITKVIESAATGGSQTTTVDTGHSEPDDYFTNGVIWWLSGHYVDKFDKVTAWDDGTHTFTHADQLGTADGVEAADRYAAINNDFRKEELIA